MLQYVAFCLWKYSVTVQDEWLGERLWERKTICSLYWNKGQFFNMNFISPSIYGVYLGSHRGMWPRGCRCLCTRVSVCVFRNAWQTESMFYRPKTPNPDRSRVRGAFETAKPHLSYNRRVFPLFEQWRETHRQQLRIKKKNIASVNVPLLSIHIHKNTLRHTHTYTHNRCSSSTLTMLCYQNINTPNQNGLPN